MTPQWTGALVLGGGGPVGASWTSALVHGLRSAGLPTADVVLGTSAGAVVGAWLTTSPDDLPALSEKMRARAAWHAANTAAGHGDKSLLLRAVSASTPDPEAAMAIGRAAISAIPPISTTTASDLWRAALPEAPWSSRLGVVSVNVGTGLARVWTADDGLPLAVAVACSTAAPGAAPPVAVADSLWIDGGVRSGTNADLLTTPPGPVLVVAPIPSAALAREEAVLTERGHHVRVITANPFYRQPTDLLDLAYVDIAAAAGAKQAHDIAEDLLAWWDAPAGGL